MAKKKAVKKKVAKKVATKRKRPRKAHPRLVIYFEHRVNEIERWLRKSRGSSNQALTLRLEGMLTELQRNLKYIKRGPWLNE